MNINKVTFLDRIPQNPLLFILHVEPSAKSDERLPEKIPFKINQVVKVKFNSWIRKKKILYWNKNIEMLKWIEIFNSNIRSLQACSQGSSIGTNKLGILCSLMILREYMFDERYSKWTTKMLMRRSMQVRKIYVKSSKSRIFFFSENKPRN